MEVPLHEGFPVAPMSRLAIREAAVHAREVLNLGTGRIDFPRLLDRLTLFGIYYDVFDNSNGPVPPGVEACFVPEDRTLYLRDSVYRQLCQGGQRAVFTVGHEMGHAVLAHRRTLNRQWTSAFKIFCNSEWQANRFAAEFTMPLAEIQRLKLASAMAIAEHFGVSPAAASVRINDLLEKGEIKKKP